jgi:hypothetical protein
MGLEGYSAGWRPGVLAVDLGIAGVIQDIYEGDTAYRCIGGFVRAGSVGGINQREALDVAGHAGAVYAFGDVVIMWCRREYEQGERD